MTKTSKTFGRANFHLENGIHLHFRQGNLLAAEQEFLTAVDLEPKNIRALNAYAQLLRLGFKEFKKAKEFYTKVIDIDPTYESCYFRRGICKGHLGDLLGQILDYSYCIHRDPDRTELYISRALIKEKIGDHKGVLEDLKIAMDLGENHENVLKLKLRNEAIIMNKEYIRDGRAPIPKKESTSRVMSANKAKNTKPELTLRKALWHNGCKGYRLHPKKVPGRPDIVFRKHALAIFVNGCYWHRCEKCDPSFPKSNQKFWEEKFRKNKERDKRKIQELEAEGWRTMTIWECEIKEDLNKCVQKIRQAIND